MPFLFTTCQRGAEPALKHEIATRQRTWHFAYSRPGFVTFKLPDDTPQAAPPADTFVFARTWCFSLSKIAGDRLGDMAQQLWADPAIEALLSETPIRDLHVWERDAAVPGDDHFEPGQTPLALEIEQAIRAATPKAVDLTAIVPEAPRPTPLKRRVLDVVIVEPNEWWIGWHAVANVTQRWPGGIIPIDPPEDAVSRAYLKMEEALRWSRLPLVRGDGCAEIGCAPGGASQALLDHGLKVIGVDPAEVAPELLADPNFRHIRKRGKEVRRRELSGIRWLAADMNVAPKYTLDTVEEIVANPDATIRGLILTLKLADWTVAGQIPQWIERVQGWGYRDIRIRQLVHGRQEVCLVALRSRAQRRLRRSRRSKPQLAPGDSPSAK